MARIWRDGQTKPCTVYRLLTTGTIEEKVNPEPRTPRVTSTSCALNRPEPPPCHAIMPRMCPHPAPVYL